MALSELSLFAGAGGGILGTKLLGFRPRCAVEIDPYARKILLSRQRDGLLPLFPIWDDVSTFDGTPWRGHIDVITGGFPCQDISIAGRGAGITGKKSGLWVEMARVISEVRSEYVFMENSPALTARGLDYILGDLASMGFNAEWGVLGAHQCGAPHRRKRIWILAANSDNRRCLSSPKQVQARGPTAINGAWWQTEPGIHRVVDGMAHRVDNRVERIRGLGNGQVPAVVRLAWDTLIERLHS